jgi:hypothetical protein
VTPSPNTFALMMATAVFAETPKVQNPVIPKDKLLQIADPPPARRVSIAQATALFMNNPSDAVTKIRYIWWFLHVTVALYLTFHTSVVKRYIRLFLLYV